MHFVSRILIAIAFLTIGQISWAKRAKMIDQLEALDVNKTKQWVLYRGEDTTKPVVLFVHGGPGSPLMMFSRAFDDAFIKDFIVVHWDQRRSGKSFSKDVPLSTLTLSQIVDDGLVVTEHIKRKFSRSKIILVGHSWGSIVASHMVKARPTDFSTYISVGTVANITEADKMKYAFLKTHLQIEKDKKVIDDFEHLGQPPYKTFKQIILLSRLVWKYGGSFHKFSPDQINEAVGKTKEYSQSELEAQGSGMQEVFEAFNPFLSTYRASTSINTLDIPVVFVQGRFDMATPSELTNQFVNQLQASKGKKLIQFDESAHFPMYEEPKKFLDVLKSVAQ